MKKLIFPVLAIVFLLCACGAPASGPSAPIGEILADILEEANISEALPVSADSLSSLYGISADDIDECACCVTMNGVFPDEVIIIKAKDDAAAKRIEDCLASRLSEVMIQSKSYDAESYAVAQKCHVVKNGLYLNLFISAKHEKMNEVYSQYFK